MSYSFGVAMGTKEAVKNVLMDKQYELQQHFPQSHLDVLTEIVERMPEGHNVSMSVSGHDEAGGVKGWQSITISHVEAPVDLAALPGPLPAQATPQVV